MACEVESGSDVSMMRVRLEDWHLGDGRVFPGKAQLMREHSLSCGGAVHLDFAGMSFRPSSYWRPRQLKKLLMAVVSGDL